jgi:hypothetical protein
VIPGISQLLEDIKALEDHARAYPVEGRATYGARYTGRGGRSRLVPPLHGTGVLSPAVWPRMAQNRSGNAVTANTVKSKRESVTALPARQRVQVIGVDFAPGKNGVSDRINNAPATQPRARNIFHESTVSVEDSDSRCPVALDPAFAEPAGDAGMQDKAQNGIQRQWHRRLRDTEART